MRRFGRKKGQVWTRHSDRFRVSRAEQRKQEEGTLEAQAWGKPCRFPGRRKKRRGSWDGLVGRARKEESRMKCLKGKPQLRECKSENAQDSSVPGARGAALRSPCGLEEVIPRAQGWSRRCPQCPLRPQQRAAHRTSTDPALLHL